MVLRAKDPLLFRSSSSSAINIRVFSIIMFIEGSSTARICRHFVRRLLLLSRLNGDSKRLPNTQCSPTLRRIEPALTWYLVFYLAWRQTCLIPAPGNWVFRSPAMKGKQPYWPGTRQLTASLETWRSQPLGSCDRLGSHAHSFSSLQ
jgi:hypothetical protein